MSATAGNQDIHVKVNGQDGGEIFIKMKPTTPLWKLMFAYCNRKCIGMDSVTFLFDGGRLHPWQTPAEVCMEEGDEIDALIIQTGA